MPDLEQARSLFRSGQIAESQTICTEILHQDPTNRDALMLLGLNFQRLNDHPAALPVLETLTRFHPDHSAGWLHRGLCLISLGRVADSVDCLRRATELQPDNALGHYHYGGALGLLGRYDEALPIVRRAHELAPANPTILALYANTLKWTDGMAAAMRQYEILTATFPDFAPGWVAKALLHIALGQYEEGWKLHEWRLRLPHRTPPPAIAQYPRWNGQPVAPGAAILIHSDAGLGDAIQFCRFIPSVAATGARVVLLVPRGLTRLMRSLRGIDTVLTEGGALPDVDYQCPLLSLPLAMGVTVENLSDTGPWLHPPPDAIEAWRTRLTDVSGLCVGLVWSAAARTGEPWADAYGRRRSMNLSSLAPLAATPGATFISLQFGNGADQAAAPPPGMTLRDFGDTLGDFQETAALIANLDLVISVDTSTAHLAGAIGKPVWLMSTFDQDWRWIVGRADSPWYPRHRLFRQAASGDWTSVVDAAADALRDLTAKRR